MFLKHKLQAGADFKTTFLGSHLSASFWLAKPFYSGWWLVIFSHVKNAIREVDWTYCFFTCENIAHVEFYIQEGADPGFWNGGRIRAWQGLLPKILAICTINCLFTGPCGFQVAVADFLVLLSFCSWDCCSSECESICLSSDYFRLF